MLEQAVILAGGKGTRLGHLTATAPKALVDIAGTPLIERQLEVLHRHGVRRVLILTGHLGGALAAALGDGSRFGLALSYLREPAPLGTAGALKAAEPLLDDHFFVVYGDIVFDIDLRRLAAFHARHGGLASLVVHPNDHPFDSDLVALGAGERITAFLPKTRPPETLAANLVNAGIYVLSRRITAHVAPETFADFGLDIFPALVAGGIALHGYATPEYAKDAGTPGRRDRVAADIASGRVARSNLAQPQRAVFLDRDGVLVAERGDAVRAEDIALLPGVGAALMRLEHAGYLLPVVTNQPGIAKGFLSEAQLAAAHARMEMLLGGTGAFVHGIFFCPHHPERGFAGERPELKIACACRKPEPGLLLQAAERFNIDLNNSFIIGDRTVDIEAGRRAGVRTIGVATGHGCRDSSIDVEPDFRVADLAAAARLILEESSP